MKRLTVSSLFRQRRWSSANVPFLRMSGRWLAKAGFQIGSNVAVHVEAGTIIIRAI